MNHSTMSMLKLTQRKLSESKIQDEFIIWTQYVDYFNKRGGWKYWLNHAVYDYIYTDACTITPYIMDGRFIKIIP